MSHKQVKILHEIYTDPPSANIHWRDVESMLGHFGAVVETHGARVHATLNGVEGILHRPHHGGTLTKSDVRHLREYLASAGLTLSAVDKPGGS